MKGSFTGAYRDKPGKLEMARNGTIFLDEIGEMTSRMQGLLLRFLETGEFQKVGAEQVAMAPNVRVIAATNRNLRDPITQGLFREDLFFRLNVIHLIVPPLRERREDIPRWSSISCRTSPTRRAAATATAAAAGPLGVRTSSPRRWKRLRRRVAGQRAAAGKRDRAAHRDRRGGSASSRRICRSRFGHPSVSRKPIRERRRTVADDLFKKLTDERQSFWATVYPLYMNREITRAQRPRPRPQGTGRSARQLQDRAAKLFNMEPRDYKRFLNFLRKHDCQLPFKEYRQ